MCECVVLAQHTIHTIRSALRQEPSETVRSPLAPFSNWAKRPIILNSHLVHTLSKPHIFGVARSPYPLALLFLLFAHFIRRLYASRCDCSVFYWHIRSKRRHILHGRNSVNGRCALNDSETGFSRRCFWCAANWQIPCGAQATICERAAIKLRYKWLCMPGLSISWSFWRIIAEMQEWTGGKGT